MAFSNVGPPPRRKRVWLRTLVWIFSLLIVLVVAVYFVATSSAFFKSVVLPRVSNTMNAEVTVSDASISPFKEVVLKDLKVKPPGAEPLLTAPEVRARYHLFDIIRGHINVDEVTISSPTIVLVENPDGSRNMDALTKKPVEKKKAPAPAPSKAAPQLDVKKITISDATIRQTTTKKDGSRDLTELSHVNISVDDLKNGQSGKLLVNADVKSESTVPPKPGTLTSPSVPGTNGSLQAKVNGNFVFSLTSDLKPASVTGNTKLEITQASGTMADFASLASELDCEITPKEVKQLALRFHKASTRLGELRASGPFDLEKTEGRLKVELSSIDKQVLNLLGAKSGLDFGGTTVNSTNDIQLAKGGTAITAVGQLNLGKMQVTLTNQTTPPLDLTAQYDVTVDQASKTALLRTLTLTGVQKGSPLLQGGLTNPMTIAWGEAANGVGDSALNLTVNQFDLADWKPFLGEIAPVGTANLKLKLLSQKGGKQLTFDLSGLVDNLTANVGSNQLTQATVAFQARGQAADLKQYKLSEYNVQISRQKQPLVDLTGSGSYDKPADIADIQLNLRTTLARLVQALPQLGTNMAITSGTAELKGQITQKANNQTVTGNLVLAELTGKIGTSEFRNFGATIDLHVNKTPQEILFPKIVGHVTEGAKPGGSFAISGSYGTNKTLQLTATLNQFNQDGLRPFLEPLLADKKLVSVAVNGTANTQYNPQGDSTIKANLQLTNLVVSDPQNQFPATPLEAKVQVDTSIQKQVADLRQCQLTLTPTPLGKNELQLQGRVDLSQTTNYAGNLKLAAESLDLTTYYDLFAGDKAGGTNVSSAKPGGAPARKDRGTPSAPVASTPTSPKEPDPIHLPLRNFTAEVNIGRLHLREVAITNLLTTAKIDGGHVVLNPLKFGLNGAPVDANADLDLGVPGYKYDASFNLQRVPLAPLVNSFDPEKKGKLGGTLTAQGKLAGAGTTGDSLQKTLTGQFDISSTNLNLSVVDIKARWLKALINVVAAIPELLRNPESAISTVFHVATGLGSGGLMEELKRSPIDSVAARGVAGSGKIELQQAVVQSPAFRSDAKGTIMLDSVLTNSTLNVPVSISLSQPIAQRINLAAAATNAAYAKLPDFYTMRGTIGDPKNDINKVALLGLAAKGVIGAIPGNIGGRTGDLLRGLGNFLPGATPQTTNPPAPVLTNTNQAATNPPPPTVRPPANQPTTTTNPPATNQSPLNGLLDQLLKPKKK